MFLHQYLIYSHQSEVKDLLIEVLGYNKQQFLASLQYIIT